MRARVEDNVRYTAIAPLRREQRLQLTNRTFHVHVDQADGDEGAVPAPLVRVQAWRWFGPTAEVIFAKDLQRGGSR